MSPQAIRKIILEQSHSAHVGHIGCSLSVTDILCSLYGGVLRVEASDDPERDRFVLSKGHAALALYAVLALKGLIPLEQTGTYCSGQTLLGVHPEHDLPGVDFCTGSLGMGLSMATGAALAARLQKSPRRVWTLLSDAECDEGSTWEAVMFAGHHRLSNLTAIIDFNGQQAFGYTRDVLDQSTMADRWRAFGWAVEEVDGHDVAAMTAALERPRDVAPRVLIAHTVFGKGVSFMERQIKWHYYPMSAEQYAQAMKEIGATP